MPYLKFYSKEREEYPDYFKLKYPTPKEANKIVRKLLRHFKLNLNRFQVIYTTNSWGFAYWWGIKLPKKNISLGMICHEIGHHLARKKTGQSKHNKKTWIKMKQVFRYAKRYLLNEVICDNCISLCKRDVCEVTGMIIRNVYKKIECDDHRRVNGNLINR